MDLHEAANAPGFGSGKRVRDAATAEAKIRETLPPPDSLPPVMASTDYAANWLIASFGNDAETDEDWHLTTVNVRASETLALSLMDSAKRDAEVIAAIVNAYRLGILVPSTTTGEMRCE